MFYEAHQSTNADHFMVATGVDFNFPPHLHNSFELITVTEGKMTVTVDKKQYIVTPGLGVLVFPNQIHTINTHKHSKHILCIFSSQFIRAYSSIYLGKVPESNLFTLKIDYMQKALGLRERNNTLAIKGLLYTICSEFDQNASYRERKTETNDLLIKIFQFVEGNYSGDCSLDALSAHTSYHSAYLSRYFKSSTGLTFTDYVNRYRINEASYMLKNSQVKVLQIAYNCGYNTLRSFNRNFKRITGITPNEYR